MATLSHFQFSARPGFPARIVGTQFQAEVNGQWQTVHTVKDTPADKQVVTVTLPSAVNASALRAVLPKGSYGNLASLKVFNGKTELTGTTYGPSGFHEFSGPAAVYTAVFDGKPDTYFDSPIDEVVTLGLRFTEEVAAVKPVTTPVVATTVPTAPVFPLSYVKAGKTITVEGVSSVAFAGTFTFTPLS